MKKLCYTNKKEEIAEEIIFQLLFKSYYVTESPSDNYSSIISVTSNRRSHCIILENDYLERFQKLNILSIASA